MAGAETGPTLSVDSGTAGMGEIVEIPVRLEGNPGFAGYQMDIVYDPALLLPLELEEGLGGAPVYNLQGVNGAQSCVKTAYAGMVDVQGDGVLFTLRFQVKEALQPGQSAALSLQNVLFFSAGGQNITPALRDGAVSAGEAPVSAGQTVSDGGSASGQGTPAPSGASPSSDPAGGQAAAPAGSAGGASASSLPAASGTASSAGGGVSSGQSSAGQDGQTASPAPSSSADAPAAASSSLPVVVFVGLGALLLAAAVCALVYFLKKRRHS